MEYKQDKVGWLEGRNWEECIVDPVDLMECRTDPVGCTSGSSDWVVGCKHDFVGRTPGITDWVVGCTWEPVGRTPGNADWVVGCTRDPVGRTPGNADWAWWTRGPMDGLNDESGRAVQKSVNK